MITQDTSTELIIVTGFLTERNAASKALQGSALESLDFTAVLDSRAWLSVARSITRAPVEVSSFEWANQSLFHMISEVLDPFAYLLPRRRGRATPPPSRQRLDYSVLESSLKARAVWNEAIAQSAPAARALSEHLERALSESAGEVHVIGHSLGGRVVLQALTLLIETCGPEITRRLKVSAWAPAIARREVSWDILARSINAPEIVLSRADIVLRVLFPLGQLTARDLNPITLLKLAPALLSGENEVEGPLQRAVGYSGPPEMWLRPERSVIDVSAQSITHLGYLPAFEYVMRQSPELSQLLKGDVSSALDVDPV